MGGLFEIAGQRVICYNGGPQFTFSQGISLMVEANTQDESVISRRYRFAPKVVAINSSLSDVEFLGIE